MFTGLVKALGRITRFEERRIVIRCPAIAPDLELGDSVAVNGVCLTVTACLPDGFTADISPETLERSNLGMPGLRHVNIEPSLRVGDKLGGHFVSGHIDGTGSLEAVTARGGSWELDILAPPVVARYVIPKGSIAVNGISLTVARCDRGGEWFRVAVIPHTYEHTNLHELAIGSAVNLEGDMLGKFVEKFVRGRGDGAPSPTDAAITPEFLSQHGWL